MKQLIDFLEKLEDKKIYYKLNKVRDAVMVEVAVPGERWEIEFFANGNIEVEKFVSNGEILDADEIEKLFMDFD